MKIRRIQCAVFLLCSMVLTFTSVAANAPVSGGSVDIFSKDSNPVALFAHPEHGGAVYTTDAWYIGADGKDYPAYCLDPGLDGVGETAGNSETIDLSAPRAVPAAVRGMVLNGFPYKPKSDYGLEAYGDWFAAYATKMAVKAYQSGWDANDFTALDSNASTLAVLAACKQIYNAGIAHPAASSAITMTVAHTPSAELSTGGVDYIVSTYTVSPADKIDGYTVSITGANPHGAEIVNTSNVAQTTFTSPAQFRVRVDKSVLAPNSASFSVNIKIDGEIRTEAMFFGKTRIAGQQNYIVTASPFELKDASSTFSYSISPEDETTGGTTEPTTAPPPSPPPVDVEFRKVEHGTTTGLPGAVFRLTQLSHWELRMIDPDLDDTENPNPAAEDYDDIFEWLEIRETEIAGTFVSGADGFIPVGELEAGSYTIEEISPPAGYALADNSSERIQFFDVPREGGYTVKITFANKKLPGLTVLKVDEDTGLPLAGAEFSIKHNGNIVYEGLTDASGVINLADLPEGWYQVRELAAPHGYLIRDEVKDVFLSAGGSAQLKFDNRRKPTLKIEKRDAQTMQPLAGAKFRVNETEGGTVGEYTTGADGTVTIENLNDVIYSIEEITAPDGYLLDPQHKDVKLEWGKVTTVVFTDRLKPGLTITKVDEQTGAALADAHFRVESLDQSGYFYEGVTDGNGQIHLDNLPEGVYEITETEAPNGYIKVNHPKQVQLIGDSVVNVLFNNLKKPTLTVIKYDELTNLPLAGASFRLWKTEGETWSETQITGADGKITWTDLDPGIYSVQEIDEPYGYFKDPQRKEILLEGGDSKQLEFFNRPRPVLTILKRDAITGVPLKDVKFRVQKLEGATIGEFLTDANGRIELSPSTGYLLTEEIYRVTEIVPPNEYLLSVNPQKDVLVKWYEPTELIFENVLKPTLIFIKRDGMSGRGISGATYKVEYESPTGGVTNIGSYVTKCGLIVLPHVLPGWYSLTETSPASGYQLPTNPTQRLHLAPGENSYTYAQTHEDLYVDARTNPNSGNKGMCGDWCGYLCSVLCAGNCGNAGDGTMANGGGGTFGNITITNGNGEVIGGNTGGGTSDTTAPKLTAGTVTRLGNYSATITFTSSEAGRYYTAYTASGNVAPTISTLGTGTACTQGSNTITVSLTTGAKDFYIKVKDAAGNVSDALKIVIPVYNATAPTETPDTPDFSGIVIQGGTVVYLNQSPEFAGITITFGN
ncbi:hypothetical protein FACS1894105_05680 [Clostridia bacterium]|nr:hypothetical protein FACS1894105_05680 [Clostridia bacterium]